MKRLWIPSLLLALSLLLVACDGTTPSNDGQTTSATTAAIQSTTAATTEATEETTATTAATTAGDVNTPVDSEATPLFTLLTSANYDPIDYVSTATGGYIPVEELPPPNEELLGKKMTINFFIEESPIYYYYCQNTEKNTERLAIVVGARMNGVVHQPLLLVAEVDFGGIERFRELLDGKSDFEIEIIAVANLCFTEAYADVTYSAQDPTLLPPPSVPVPEGLVEYGGVAGGTQKAEIYPRAMHYGFPFVLERHALEDIMGIYTLPPVDAEDGASEKT